MFNVPFPVCLTMMLPTSCSDFHIFSSVYFFFEAWRRPPLAADADNYTNTDKSASTVTHSEELGGFCRTQLATVSNACAKQKTRKLVSQEPTRGRTVCREPERPGTMEREKRIRPPRPRSLSPRHTEVRKNHTGLLKSQSGFVFVSSFT